MTKSLTQTAYDSKQNDLVNNINKRFAEVDISKIDVAFSSEFGKKIDMEDFVPLEYVKKAIMMLRKIREEDESHDLDGISLEFYETVEQIFEHKNVFHSNFDLLLKELFQVKDFIGVLLKIQKNIYLKDIVNDIVNPVTVTSFLLSSDRSFSVYESFKNILICCRILLPDQQIDIYLNFEPLVTCAKEVAAIHGQDWPGIDSLVSCVFDFEIAPVSYSLTAQTTKEHRFAFIEALWEFTPVVLLSALEVGGTKENLAVHLKYVWKTVTAKKSKGESLKMIASRCIKETESWIPGKTDVALL
jgi:hypothetical protein